MKLGILASGELGLKCIQSLPEFASIECVLTDSRSVAIIEWCKQQEIPFFAGNPRSGRTEEFRKRFQVDVLVSINYLFIVETDLINWARHAFNIHGALLPRYRGRAPHIWAIINNETVTGITVHMMDEGCDSGDIILQKEITIDRYMTGFDVLQRFQAMYPASIAEALQLIHNGSLKLRAQDNSKATYFGKRTPEDGLINWDWQRERIYNWVRALAKPYPGAFTFYRGDKLIVHTIEPDDSGFNYQDANGSIIDIVNGLPVVKTPNGAVRLIDFELHSNIELKKGEVLHG